MRYQDNQELMHAILSVLSANGKPIGSGTLYYSLRERGLTVSAPTIGRRLQELETQGLLRKASVDGRVLTPEGRQFFERLNEDRHLDNSGREFLSLLKAGSRQEILEVLQTRRIVECETAALAAMKSSPKLARRLTELISKQKRLLDKGELGIEEDVSFHEAIADASGNRVLAGVTRLLRSHLEVNRAVSVIRARLGARVAQRHHDIVKAIRNRDPEAARRAMDRHISELITDVDRYWKQVFKSTDGGRELSSN